VHKQGPDRVWPKCIECQLMHRNAGDFWIIGGSTMKVDGVVKKGHARKKQPCNEKKPGEWNSYDIVCDGASVKPSINGLLQNEGTESSVSSGYICLQSEGSPIEFRNEVASPTRPLQGGPWSPPPPSLRVTALAPLASTRGCDSQPLPGEDAANRRATRYGGWRMPHTRRCDPECGTVQRRT